MGRNDDVVQSNFRSTWLSQEPHGAPDIGDVRRTDWSAVGLPARAREPLRFVVHNGLHSRCRGACIAADDCQRGCWVASYPAKTQQVDRPSTDGSTIGQRDADAQSPDGGSARPPSTIPHANGPFVHSSAQRRPQ